MRLPEKRANVLRRYNAQGIIMAKNGVNAQLLGERAAAIRRNLRY